MNLTPALSTLGKKAAYENTYNPSLLFPISRSKNRAALRLQPDQPLPFFGFDCWNHYEVSWLNERGKPIVAIAEIFYPCESTCIIESKSMKLYFNSFNNSSYKDVATVEAIIQQDIATRINSDHVTVLITPLSLFKEEKISASFDGQCLDALDIGEFVYHHHPDFLKTDEMIVSETVFSDLIKSNCLVTNQPDWCSVQICYTGRKIQHEGLLRYLVSFRDDNEFHEHCIEKIFMDLLQRCKPSELTVYGRSTRRGGIDINSTRSTTPLTKEKISNHRLSRQ